MRAASALVDAVEASVGLCRQRGQGTFTISRLQAQCDSDAVAVATKTATATGKDGRDELAGEAVFLGPLLSRLSREHQPRPRNADVGL